MPKASNMTWNRNTSFLLKSPPGFGKTIAACSAAIYGEVFLAYIDKAQPTEVLSYYKKHRPELLEKIEYECYSSNNIYMLLNKLIDFANPAKGCTHSAIIIDGVTTLTRAAVNWSMGFRDPKGPDRDKVQSKAPQLIPDWDEYKVETSMVTQMLDICKTLKCMIIWTAHPLPSMNISGSGSNVDSITKTQSLVSYGSKVGAMLPGDFSEIYHLGRQGDARVVWTDMIGDDFARTSLPLTKSFDITNKLFFEVWQEQVKLGFEKLGGGNGLTK